MNKKELESVYNHLENTIIKLGRQNGKTQAVKDLIYLFEQAELNQDLQEQNERYREALEFYAKRKNYKPEHFDENINEYMSSIEYDEGFLARKALEEKE